MKKYVWNGSEKPSKKKVCSTSTTMLVERPAYIRRESERDIFHMCQGKRMRKRSGGTVNECVGKAIYLRRFANSRLTCVYKAPKW